MLNALVFTLSLVCNVWSCPQSLHSGVFKPLISCPTQPMPEIVPSHCCKHSLPTALVQRGAFVSTASLTAGGMMVWHIRSPPGWWEASAGVGRVDVRSFQTLINAEGKSTLENLGFDRGGTAEPFITLSINVLGGGYVTGRDLGLLAGKWGDARGVLVSTLPGPEQSC